MLFCNKENKKERRFLRWLLKLLGAGLNGGGGREHSVVGWVGLVCLWFVFIQCLSIASYSKLWIKQ